MARPHPGREAMYKYLQSDFPWKKDLKIDGEIFPYQKVKEAMSRLATTDPSLHRHLAYRWLSDRSRNDIAFHLNIDSSTLKRVWDKACDIIMNHLRHGINDSIAPKLDAVDILDPTKL